MEFCDDCESLLFLKCEYVKESSDEGKEDTIKLDKSRLVYSCKICGFQKSTKKKDRCLYNNDYSKDLLSNKIVTNPYICLDPTLPILNTIKCPNSDCVVNKKDEYFKNKLVLNNVFFNLNNKITNHIQSILEKTGLTFTENEEVSNGEFKIMKVSTSIYLEFSDDLDAKKLDEYKKILKSDEMLEYYDIEINKLNRLKNRVTYIKYDNVKMKFMYICCHCNTYWKR